VTAAVASAYFHLIVPRPAISCWCWQWVMHNRLTDVAQYFIRK